MALQFRDWRKLAELERRARTGRRHEQAAALYEQGAAFYHDPDVLSPAYGRATENFGWMLARGRSPTDWGRFVETSVGYARAAELFERVAREHSDWDGLDRALFSRGLALRRLLDYRPSREAWWRPAGEEGRSIRAAVEALERCAALCPQSPLADDAARAAAYWRRTRPDAFRG